MCDWKKKYEKAMEEIENLRNYCFVKSDEHETQICNWGDQNDQLCDKYLYKGTAYEDALLKMQTIYEES